jgi:hypothetical protein
MSMSKFCIFHCILWQQPMGTDYKETQPSSRSANEEVAHRPDTHSHYKLNSRGLIRHRNNHHLGRNSGPKCQQKHVGVYVRVCMHRKVLVAWPGRDQGDGVILIVIVENTFTMTLHSMLKYGQCYVITYITNKLLLVTWSTRNTPINLGQFRFTEVSRGQI